MRYRVRESTPGKILEKNVSRYARMSEDMQDRMPDGMSKDMAEGIPFKIHDNYGQQTITGDHSQ